MVLMIYYIVHDSETITTLGSHPRLVRDCARLLAQKLRKTMKTLDRHYQGSNLGFGKLTIRIPSDIHYTIVPY